jgi:hypothetical protein
MYQYSLAEALLKLDLLITYQRRNENSILSAENVVTKYGNRP